MRNFISSLAKWEIFILTIVIMVIIIMSAGWLGSLRHHHEEDRSDYKVVAEDFIKTSVFVANKLGKVTELSHIGKGGSSENTSYNVFKARGQENVGIINITLTRDIENNWFVTYADLATGGKVFSIPIKTSEGSKWKEFKLR